MKKEKSEFNILKDEPLVDKEADRFGYSDIADKLTDIIQNIESPFTIGLYGKWGSGKTSICKLVEKNFERSDDFRVFYFDVWKYEKDSFRRQFLIELDEKIFEGKLKYREILNQSLTVPKKLSLKQNIGIIFDDLIIKVFGLFSLIMLFFFFLKSVIIPYIATENIVELFKKFIDLGLFINIFYLFLSSFKFYQGFVQIHKTDSAEGFEHFYKDALKKLNKRKLFVIIDNLDRLTSGKAVGVLSDIKTFLAKDKDRKERRDGISVFLIPCDNEALSTHLYRVYDKDFDADEFLRKFFNLTFKIPKLLDVELDEYILEKLKETNISEFQENITLSFVIMKAFRDNPREIIQFINSLTTSYLLAKYRGLSEVRDNVAFLAKILVIRQKWPLEYIEIENKILRTGLNLDDAVKFPSSDDEKAKCRIKKIDEFLKITLSINVDNHDIFFSLHKSRQEAIFPEWTGFIQSAEEKRDKDLKGFYVKAKNNNQIQEVNRLLIDYCRKNKKNKVKLLNVFISIVKILGSKEQLEDFKEFLSNSFEILNEQNIYIDSINDINFTNLLNENATRIIPRAFYDRFLSTIIGILILTKDTNQPAIELSKGIELFQLISTTDFILERIGKKHYDSWIDAKNRFIQIVNVDEIINNADKNEQLNKFTSFILDTKPITAMVIPASLDKINEIAIHSSIGEDVWQVLETTEQLLDKITHPNVPSPSYITSVQNISTTIINRYNQTPDWTKRSILAKIVFSLKEVNGNNLVSQLNDLVTNFISDVNNPNEKIFSVISKEKLTEMITKEPFLKVAIINRSKRLPDIFIRYNLKDYFEEQEIDTIIKPLISCYEQFLKFLKYLDFKLLENSRKWLIESMTNNISQVPLEFFEEWLIGVKKLKIADYSDFIEKFRIALKSAKQRGEEFDNKIKDFVSKNKKLFEGIVDELTK